MISSTSFSTELLQGESSIRAVNTDLAEWRTRYSQADDLTTDIDYFLATCPPRNRRPVSCYFVPNHGQKLPSCCTRFALKASAPAYAVLNSIRIVCRAGFVLLPIFLGRLTSQPASRGQFYLRDTFIQTRYYPNPVTLACPPSRTHAWSRLNCDRDASHLR